jgi:hypothetical protein
LPLDQQIRDAGQAAPSGKDRQPPRTEQPDPADRVLYLIALKDHWVYAAVAYWIDGGMLHYITAQGIHNQVSLELVDRQTSTKLNPKQRVEYGLASR